jgi:hypothetical protein
MARGNAAHYPDNCGHGNGIQLGTAYLTVAEPVGREVLISQDFGRKTDLYRSSGLGGLI